MDLITLKNRNFEDEFVFTASRSTGPGGQNVNKVNTKVELSFNIRQSGKLTEEEKVIILEKLGRRINKDGELLIISQAGRSQLKNKDKAIQKFYDLLVYALAVKKARIVTRPTAASRRARLEEKKIRSLIKKSRHKPRNMPDD